ncbi:MAG: sigma-70 family RNA polymerase sigma factor [Planctomycetota bacterium]
MGKAVDRERKIESLVKRIQAGEKDAMNELYVLLEEELVMFVYRKMNKKLRNLEGTRDLIQTLWRGLCKDFGCIEYRGPHPFVNYVKKRLLNKIRKKRPKIIFIDSETLDTLPHPTPFTPLAEFESLENEERFKKAWEAFSADPREILHYRSDDDMTYEEIGRLMDKSSEAVRKLFKRSIDKLRSRLKERDKSAPN